jgi:hypothetical protein
MPYLPQQIRRVQSPGTLTSWHKRPKKPRERRRRTNPLPRCAIPTLEHGDLPRDTDALRVPAAHNRVSPLDDFGPQPCAGVYAQVLDPGRVQVGDTVRLA